jgi:4-amino-4-deoxy-L-arabinose transferase-like glycosyltransferase
VQPETAATATNYKLLRISCWVVALALGTAQAWATRFTMNPDGISYLDIGDAYWRGDWHNAINAYWSPLYSWILGFFLKVLKPSAYWEYPLAHLVNFLIYVLALACFEFFLVTLIRECRRPLAGSGGGEIGLSEVSWWLLGYSVFLSTSLLMISLRPVTPDMGVAALVYLATALALKISNRPARGTYVALGLVLGLAYLSKGVMLPLAFVFLAAVLLTTGFSRSSLRNIGVATLVFLCVASPFGLALSYSQGRITFGDVGPIAYEIYLDRIDVFAPNNPGLLHPVRNILDQPHTIEFSEPIAGTYPLWYEPSYWHAGLKPHWNLRGELPAIGLALLLYVWIPVTYQLNLTAPFLMLLLVATRPWACCKRAACFWQLTLPAVLALLLYAMVYAESRYLAPFYTLLWLAAFSGLRFPDSLGMKRLMTIAAIAVFVSQFAVYRLMKQDSPDSVYWNAAQGLKSMGLKPGDKLAVFAREPFSDGGAFVARLDRAKIVIESRDTEGDWVNDAVATARLTDLLKKNSVRAALWYGNPPIISTISWKRLGQTRYYTYFLSVGDISTAPR